MQSLDYRAELLLNSAEHNKQFLADFIELFKEVLQENKDLKEALNHKKTYEDYPIWSTEEVADYFRVSRQFIIQLIHVRKLPVIKKCLFPDSKKPDYGFPRELVYKLKRQMTINI